MKPYISHKRVEAARIEGVSDDAMTLTVLADGVSTYIHLTPEMIARYKPQVGDYLVRYARDGYEAISPRAVFEDGYSPVRDGIRIFDTIPETNPHDPAENAEYTAIVNIARICHEANRAYCVSLGDHSQPSWGDAPAWQQAYAMEGVRFNRANPDAPASASHESWLAQAAEDGWTYGPEKNIELKQHPCLAPYAKLPPEQQRKDALFKAIVNTMSAPSEAKEAAP